MVALVCQIVLTVSHFAFQTQYMNNLVIVWVRGLAALTWIVATLLGVLFFGGELWSNYKSTGSIFRQGDL